MKSESLNQPNPFVPVPDLGDDLYRSLLEFKDYAIVMLDASGIVRTWNLGAQYLFGCTSDAVLGQHFAFLCRFNGDKTEATTYLSDALAGGRRVIEGWLQDTTASIYIHLILTPLFSLGETLRGYALVARDMTVQKKLEEENRILHEHLEDIVRQRTSELASVNKELEAFSYSVSHDLRTPLRAISGYSMMLQEDYASSLDAEANRIINTIVANTRMMGQLIDDLLTFSHLGRLAVESAQVSMRRIVDECILELLPLEARHPEFILHDLPVCKGDPRMLKQVWINLIGNALKYSAHTAKRRIEIGGSDSGAVCEYYIRDNGAGFDMRYSDKLFGVFQRLHRQDEFEGTGLGLALARRIIHKHGGDIRGEGKTGEGATFYFTLPQ